MEARKPSLYLSNSPSDSQDLTEEIINTIEPAKELFFDSQRDTNGTNDVCDHIPTTNEESINNNNNNNNHETATKKSPFIPNGSSATDILLDGVEPPKNHNEDSDESRVIEERKEHVFENSTQTLKNGILDHFETKEYENKKYPKGHE
jgi:hypothetical protein